ncbi:hypothetical protein K438DRAFT_2104337 [Mycena galopus ATCC 62051]|nr:hypothetical protein K438DRAFT_2104337 [Mycena galopus ATCC 62051]
MASLLLRIATTSSMLTLDPLRLQSHQTPTSLGFLHSRTVPPCARAARQKVWWNLAPSPTFESSWPAPLRVYHATYELVAPFFPVLESSASDAENRKTIDTMRARIRCGGRLLARLRRPEHAVRDARLLRMRMFPEARLSMGRLACGPRSADRDFAILPLELDEPWFLLQRYFGFTSPGGSLSSLLYFNTRGVDTNFKPFYSSVHGMPQVHQKTANWDARLFLETEHRASRLLTPLQPGLTADQSLPMYRLIAETISACGSSAGDCPLDALTSLKEANVVFQNTYRFFFENMNDANISHALWLAYLQGYTGWTLPGADSVVISGVSGGILPAPPATEEALHLPVAQRDWLCSLREFDIRAKVRSAIERCADAPDSAVAEFWKEMQDELEKMVQKLRLWRMGHMTRMVPFEAVHRPERVFMTAGRSLPPEGEVSDETGMVHHLKEVLQERLIQTV